MARIGPVSGFKQGGADQADVDHLAAYPINFDPVSNANAILPHEHEPSEEGHDEVFENDGEAGSGQSDDGRHLPWRSENDNEDESKSGKLNRELEHHPHVM